MRDDIDLHHQILIDFFLGKYILAFLLIHFYFLYLLHVKVFWCIL